MAVLVLECFKIIISVKVWFEVVRDDGNFLMELLLTGLDNYGL